MDKHPANQASLTPSNFCTQVPTQGERPDPRGPTAQNNHARGTFTWSDDSDDFQWHLQVVRWDIIQWLFLEPQILKKELKHLNSLMKKYIRPSLLQSSYNDTLFIELMIFFFFSSSMLNFYQSQNKMSNSSLIFFLIFLYTYNFINYHPSQVPNKLLGVQVNIHF